MKLSNNFSYIAQMRCVNILKWSTQPQDHCDIFRLIFMWLTRPHAPRRARPHASPTHIIFNLQTPEQCHRRRILGRPVTAFISLIFALFSTKSSPKCHKLQEEEVYTSLELQIPRKLVGKFYQNRPPSNLMIPTSNNFKRGTPSLLGTSLSSLWAWIILKRNHSKVHE